ncbi:MAG: hypothetical protein U0793_09325 [Gemmataceae bacterium]
MSPTLQGFVYAEDRDGVRSLGFKLLAPGAAPWAAEVETLARKLQACPCPEGWPSAGLFCSVLLEDGQRLVALARYGVRDHSPGQRPGGLELIGGVGPARLDLGQARAVVDWLRERRDQVDDPRELAGPIALDHLPAPRRETKEPASGPPADAARLACWSGRLAEAGTLLLSGAAADEPDRTLASLTSMPERWQWLPYCGADFPFETWARRGPLLAWLPPRADLSLLLTRPRVEAAPAAAPSKLPWIFAGGLLVIALCNIWAWLTLPGRLPPAAPPVVAPAQDGQGGAGADGNASVLPRPWYRLAASRSGGKLPGDEAARSLYERLLATDPDLRVDAREGQAFVAASSRLADYQPDRIARLIVEEFGDKKGIDPEIVRLISDRVRQRLLRDSSGK